MTRSRHSPALGLCTILVAPVILLLVAGGCAPPRQHRPSQQPVSVPQSPQRPAKEPAPAPSSPAPSPTSRPAAEEELSIVEAFRRGDYRHVVAEFEKIQQMYPAYMRGADDLYLLGMSHYYLEENEKALKAFLEFQYRFTGDGRNAEVHLMAAKVFRRMGKTARALDSLLMAVHLSEDPGLRVQAWEEKADILAGQGRYLEALEVLDEAFTRSEGGARGQILTRIKELLLVMPIDIVEGSVLRGNYRFPRETAESVLERHRRRGGAEGLAVGTGRADPAVAGTTGTVRADERPLVRLGVLAPREGRLEGYGEEVRRGTELALQVVAGEAFPFRTEAVFVDEESLREGGGEIQTLMADRSVIAVIGPLLSDSVERILPRAEREGLAVFSPTATSFRLNGISPNFFRNCLTIDQIGRSLAAMAMERLGLASFALFFPDDLYGFNFSESFRQEVLRRGGQVIASGSYDGELTDFAIPIKALKADAGIPETPPEQRPEKPEEVTPLPFEGIFMPGRGKEVGLILPQLAFHDIDIGSITVIGGGGLNSERFPEVGEEYAEGVVFADGFFADSPRLEVQEFVRRFRELYGDSPGGFAAQAYDATAIVLDALQGGAGSRQSMLAALGVVRDFPGVCGTTSLYGGGYLERDPFFGTVHLGHIVGLEFGEGSGELP